jgi:hypothetical protein
MAMSLQTRTKRGTAAAALVPGGVQPVDYVLGRGKARFARGPAIAMAAFIVVFVVALALGYLVFPGVVLLIYVVKATRPPRGILVTTQGLVLVELSIMNGQPRKVLAYLPLDSVPPPGAAGEQPRVDLGPDTLTFRPPERHRLTAATTAARVAWTNTSPAY